MSWDRWIANSINLQIFHFIQRLKSNSFRSKILVLFFLIGMLPVAAIMPNMTQKIPPMIGSGIVIKRAPNFDNKPKNIIIRAAAWITRLLPTYLNLNASWLRKIGLTNKTAERNLLLWSLRWLRYFLNNLSYRFPIPKGQLKYNQSLRLQCRDSWRESEAALHLRNATLLIDWILIFDEYSISHTSQSGASVVIPDAFNSRGWNTGQHSKHSRHTDRR